MRSLALWQVRILAYEYWIADIRLDLVSFFAGAGSSALGPCVPLYLPFETRAVLLLGLCQWQWIYLSISIWHTYVTVFVVVTGSRRECRHSGNTKIRPHCGLSSKARRQSGSHGLNFALRGLRIPKYEFRYNRVHTFSRYVIAFAFATKSRHMSYWCYLCVAVCGDGSEGRERMSESLHFQVVPRSEIEAQNAD